MRRICLPLCLLALVAVFAAQEQLSAQSPPAAQNSAAVYRDQMDKAQKLVQAGDDAAAIIAYQRASEAGPLIVSPWVGLENAYLRLKKYEDALAAARMIPQLAPREIAMVRTSHYVAGVALLGLGDEKNDPSKYVEAEKELRTALEQFVSTPPVPVTRYYYGLALMKIGRREEAVEQLRLYLKQQPGGMFASEARQYVYNGADENAPEDLVVDPQLRKADEWVSERQYDDAITVYKWAIKMRPDSAQPYIRLAETYHKIGAYKDCLEATHKATPLTGNKILLTSLHNLAGVSLIGIGDAKRDPKAYVEAEKELRTAVGLMPEWGEARFNLARALLKQGRDQDGTVELKRYLEQQPKGEFARTAERYIQNPRRAREDFVLDFALTTLQGERISADSLQGKILLLHFWASWSPTSRRDLGSVQKLARKYAGDPVVVLSVSADRDERIWRQWIADKKMEWPQYWDDTGRMARVFGVKVYPTYVIVDGDGVIRHVQAGAGGIEGEVKKALKSLPASKGAKPGI